LFASTGNGWPHNVPQLQRYNFAGSF